MAGRWAWGGMAALFLFSVAAFSQTLFDFVAEAPRAQWFTDQGAGLPCPGTDTDARGFALVRPSAVLEDGRTYTNVLETHPR